MYHVGDLVKHRRTGCLYRIMTIPSLGTGIYGQRMTKEGIAFDLRMPRRRLLRTSEIQPHCLACAGAHHIQRCPHILVELLRQ